MKLFFKFCQNLCSDFVQSSESANRIEKTDEIKILTRSLIICRWSMGLHLSKYYVFFFFGLFFTWFGKKSIQLEWMLWHKGPFFFCFLSQNSLWTNTWESANFKEHIYFFINYFSKIFLFRFTYKPLHPILITTSTCLALIMHHIETFSVRWHQNIYAFVFVL